MHTAHGLLFASGGLVRTVSLFVNRCMSRTGLGFLAVVVLAVAALWLGLILVERTRRYRKLTSQTPHALFLQLCRAHRLTRAERQLLWSVHAPAHPDQCCHSFIDPRVLGRQAVSSTPLADDYAALARKLFGDRAG